MKHLMTTMFIMLTLSVFAEETKPFTIRGLYAGMPKAEAEKVLTSDPILKINENVEIEYKNDVVETVKFKPVLIDAIFKSSGVDIITFAKTFFINHKLNLLARHHSYFTFNVDQNRYSYYFFLRGDTQLAIGNDSDGVDKKIIWLFYQPKLSRPLTQEDFDKARNEKYELQPKPDKSKSKTIDQAKKDGAPIIKSLYMGMSKEDALKVIDSWPLVKSTKTIVIFDNPEKIESDICKINLLKYMILATEKEKTLNDNTELIERGSTVTVVVDGYADLGKVVYLGGSVSKVSNTSWMSIFNSYSAILRFDNDYTLKSISFDSDAVNELFSVKNKTCLEFAKLFADGYKIKGLKADTRNDNPLTDGIQFNSINHDTQVIITGSKNNPTNKRIDINRVVVDKPSFN